ncbi:universal stress protein [Leisingera methylohalidivorans]|uniref:Universal stress protein UspA n=1 Tax=Leisingera methylohalidivorans DSM 14336 TaxID=999552 RepID=V9VNW5_9RHOB|nr:universal stress protein [Leisingera methylohalidivorans]AHC99388.1 universal stress protein UspA [Leisingera methylohalidivorans DSM 14336]
MFKHIMVPVDLHMPPTVKKALDVAADFAKNHGARVTLVHVTDQQVRRGHTVGSSGDELADLASKVAAQTGAKVEGLPIYSVDVGAEIDSILSRTAKELEVDLVVMGTHMPGILDYVFSSHASHLVLHSETSVFVVR